MLLCYLMCGLLRSRVMTKTQFISRKAYLIWLYLHSVAGKFNIIPIMIGMESVIVLNKTWKISPRRMNVISQSVYQY